MGSKQANATLTNLHDENLVCWIYKLPAVIQNARLGFFCLYFKHVQTEYNDGLKKYMKKSAAYVLNTCKLNTDERRK